MIAGVASGTGMGQNDGSYLFNLLTALSLALFVTSAAYMWSLGTVRGQRADWDRLVQILGTEGSAWSAGAAGVAKGLPVRVRVESDKQNHEYLDKVSAMYSDAKHFFVLTVTVPFTDDNSWRVLYKPKSAAQPKGQWQVISEDSADLSRSLEEAGITDLFSEWDKFTVLKCNAQEGELTLRYPVPHRFFCPTAEELEQEISLLRRVADIWQRAARPLLAA